MIGCNRDAELNRISKQSTNVQVLYHDPSSMEAWPVLIALGELTEKA